MDIRDRRTFLKRSVTAVSALAFTRCTPEASGPDGDTQAEEGAGLLPGEPLGAVAEVVLPGELEPEDRDRIVASFQRWLADFQPVTEQNHGYGTSEIAYGPPDPRPAWVAHLEALDLESDRRHGSSFSQLPPEARAALLRRILDDVAESRLRRPLETDHVALALMAWYYQSSEATDRCYGVQIGKLTCRGLGQVSARPEPVGRSES